MFTELVTANLAGRIRRETLHGREHIVAPLSLIAPGVLNGSNGPLLYTAEEIAKNADAWAHTPIVVYHPQSTSGAHISARNPVVLNKQGIGLVMGAKTHNGKLVAEGWFDVERTRSVDSRILSALEANQPIELSTGLFTDNEPSNGDYNGKPYTHIARNYRPDHLAILPDKIGACSIQDGCGVLVNEQDRSALAANKITNALNEFKDLWITLNADGEEMTAEKACEILRDGEANGVKLTKRQRRMFGALCGKRPKSVQNQQTQVLTEEPTEAPMPLKPEERATIINALTSNCKCEGGKELPAMYGEEDKPALNAKTDAELMTADECRKMYMKKTPAMNALTANNTPAQMTPADWERNAPPEYKRLIANARAEEARRKADYIRVITGNSRNTYTQEQLEAMDVDALAPIAAFAAPSPQTFAAPAYLGAAAPVGNYGTEKLGDDSEMDCPTINWKEIAGAR